MRVKFGAVAVAVVAATLMSVTTAITASPADAQPVRYTGGTYVAMGDSRASGGFFTPTPDYFLGCKRSAFNYPTIVRVLALSRGFIDLSCAGAVSANLHRTGQRTQAGYKPPQVHLVPRDAQLVTVSIGGNDMRWGAILVQCRTAPFTDRFCRSNRRLAAQVRNSITHMENRVTPALKAIRRKAPNAQIIVVGLGGFMGNHGCWPMVPISDPDVRWMNQVFNRANGALWRASTKVGGTFVDANRLSAGHDPCNLINPWYESSMSNTIAYPYHINQAGAIAVGAMVNGAIRR